MNNFLQKVSPRERRLIYLTGAVIIVGLAALMATSGLGKIRTMDATIAGLEQDLVYYTEQVLLADEVDAVYGEMAAQHSSSWTVEEIHDRLRREITRLALRQIIPEDAEDVGMADQDRLVVIRSMPEGKIESTGEGYRAYQVTFRAQPTKIKSISLFLERLQKSRQALRVDKLILSRGAQEVGVTAQVTVTRTVIGDSRTESPDDAGIGEVGLQNGSFEEFDQSIGAFAGWDASAAVTFGPDETLVSDGDSAARISATEPGHFSQTVQLKAGDTYTLTLDAAVTGAAKVEIRSEEGQPLSGVAILKADGAMYRYTIRFQAPGAPATSVPIQVPVIVMSQEGTVVHLDNVTLTGPEH